VGVPWNQWWIFAEIGSHPENKSHTSAEVSILRRQHIAVAAAVKIASEVMKPKKAIAAYQYDEHDRTAVAIDSCTRPAPRLPLAH